MGGQMMIWPTLFSSSLCLFICCCLGVFGIEWTGDIGQGSSLDGQMMMGDQQNLANWTDQQQQFPKGEPAHYRLERYLMANYNNRLIPRRKAHKAIQVLFTIGLYQIIEVNEPQQYILLNSWIVERWRDELLYWDIDRFEGIREIVLPRESVWIPDTTLYNSLVMDDAQSRRILNVKVNTVPGDKSALVEMLYPTLYQFSCMLDLRFFPFDIQHCVMTFGSWTHDNKNIDYFAYDDSSDRIVPTLTGNGSGGKTAPSATTRGGIGIEHCIPNEGWNILSTDVTRREVKFHCCLNNYTLLEFKLHIQRKPLFYLVNLIIPTSIITLIAIIGFFSSSTVNDAREEKISLGITTLLSMSILIFMVSDQMPSTSSFIPLIGWFYTSMMGLISCGTLAASFVIYVQKRGIIGQRPSRNTMRWARLLSRLIWLEMPLLMKQAYAIKAKQDKMQKLRQQLELQRQKCQSSQLLGGTPPRRSTWFQQKWQAAKANNNQEKMGGGGGTIGGGRGGLGPLIGRYRSELNGAGTANGRLAGGGGGGGTPLSTTFVGPTLGNAMAFLVPAGTKRKKSPPPPNAQKMSTADSMTGSMTVSFLDAPAQTHSYTSINEEEGDDASQHSSNGPERGDQGEAKMPPANSRDGSESLNLIDMDEEEEEEGTMKGEEPVEGGGQSGAEREGQRPEEAMRKAGIDMEAAFYQQQQAAGMTDGIGRKEMMGENAGSRIMAPSMDVQDGRQQQPIGSTSMNLSNPLVANAAAISPVTQFAQTMIQRVQQRERDRILSEVEARRRQTAGQKPSIFRRSGSSMADLYAACLYPPTPSDSVPNLNLIDPTTGTLDEASAALAALHPQVQRNLAEIEYDWLAAVLERMFLILFSFLFFLLSLGINGIGLYYWYFTYVDMVEKS